MDSEAHLYWIAKLAVLEDLPEGWEEMSKPDGTPLYRNHESGELSDEHPLDVEMKLLLERERAKRPPKVCT